MCVYVNVVVWNQLQQQDYSYLQIIIIINLSVSMSELSLKTLEWTEANTLKATQDLLVFFNRTALLTCLPGSSTKQTKPKFLVFIN